MMELISGLLLSENVKQFNGGLEIGESHDFSSVCLKNIFKKACHTL